MNYELFCLESNWEKINQSIFAVVDRDLYNFVAPCSVLKKISETFDCPMAGVIGHPLGISDIQAKTFEFLLYSNSLKTIDVVLNTNLLDAGSLLEVISEAQSIYLSCKGKNVKFRPIIEYKLLNTDQINFLCNKFISMGIEEMVLGTGQIVDDPDEILLISRLIQDKFGIKVVVNSATVSNDRLKLLAKFKVFGIRIKSLNTLNNLCIIK